MSKKKKNKKRKLNKKRVFTFLFIIFILVISIYKIFNTTITNIYISGNNYLTDQEIIDISKLTNYPISIKNSSKKIEKRLEKNINILSSKVKKNLLLNKVYIDIEENYPLFYYESEEKTVLYDGSKVDSRMDVFTLTNSVNIKTYNKLIDKLRKIDIDILNRISEVEYIKENKKIEKFLLLMNDGNYVYVDFKNFLKLNKYLDIIKSFGDKKGILNLDSGNNFEVFN